MRTEASSRPLKKGEGTGEVLEDRGLMQGRFVPIEVVGLVATLEAQSISSKAGPVESELLLLLAQATDVSLFFCKDESAIKAVRLFHEQLAVGMGASDFASTAEPGGRQAGGCSLCAESRRRSSAGTNVEPLSEDLPGDGRFCGSGQIAGPSNDGGLSEKDLENVQRLDKATLEAGKATGRGASRIDDSEVSALREVETIGGCGKGINF
jgi:hypothetical protein